MSLNPHSNVKKKKLANHSLYTRDVVYAHEMIWNFTHARRERLGSTLNKRRVSTSVCFKMNNILNIFGCVSVGLSRKKICHAPMRYFEEFNKRTVYKTGSGNEGNQRGPERETREGKQVRGTQRVL